ncbi:MAG: ComF family protein [Burkholderiales bacterium]|nr:ComF family protein [Burkholderiales bacterium]
MEFPAGDAVPGRCAVCGRWPAQALCRACLGRFARPRPRCRRCALPVPEGVAECGACVRTPPPLDRCHAAVDYGYPWAELVGDYKFRGQPGWAGVFATLVGAAPGVQDSLAQAEVVLPMPLAPRRLAQRGFNQALELARRLAPGKVDSHLLLRLRETLPQAELAREQRLANVRGAFAMDPMRSAALRGRRAVLVDDVMTSGASLFAAAAALREAGAAQVGAVVLARTPEPA